jgi:hypothetical protein
MDSPRNPLIQPTGERSACTYTTVYIMNQLFLSNNDVVEMNWIENEYCVTDRRKWDGAIVMVNNKTVSTVLVEFSGGVKNATIVKEKTDIAKLYVNMTKIIDSLPDSVGKRMFCVRYYGKWLLISILLID